MINDLILHQHKKILSQEDDLIKKALLNNSFALDDLDFLKKNFSFVNIEGDEFKHLYYRHGLTDEKRIISIQKQPTINFEGNKCMMEQKYY